MQSTQSPPQLSLPSTKECPFNSAHVFQETIEHSFLPHMYLCIELPHKERAPWSSLVKIPTQCNVIVSRSCRNWTMNELYNEQTGKVKFRRWDARSTNVCGWSWNGADIVQGIPELRRSKRTALRWDMANCGKLWPRKLSNSVTGDRMVIRGFLG